MVHHYREDESPDTVITTPGHVTFNCQIEPPFREQVEVPEVPEEEPEPPPPPPRKPKPSCCPVAPLAEAGSSSELVEALPTILVGIGVAYAIGMLTGAFIWSPSADV
jgi:hypothetical protein